MIEDLERSKESLFLDCPPKEEVQIGSRIGTDPREPRKVSLVVTTVGVYAVNGVYLA